MVAYVKHPVALFDISPADIEIVVQQFYARVRTDPILGPIFANHVQDWPAHECKITAFWCNAILRTQTYSGNPMQVHLAAGNIRPDHFAIWLDLFEDVLAEHLTKQQSMNWSVLARRIGRGMRMGVQNANREPGVPPSLRC